MENTLFKYRFNADDIFIRSVFASISETLTNRLSYFQIEEDDVRVKKPVPIYLSATGDERFLQYHFSGVDRETCETFVEGTIDKIPRGVIKIDNVTIDRSQLTSDFGKGRIYETDENGNVKLFTAEVRAIPLTIPINLKIVGDTINEVWKIFDNLLDTLYFNQKFRFLYKGIVCEGNINFPDAPLENKVFEFSYGTSTEKPALNVALDVVTYKPSVKEKTRYSNDKRIQRFETTIAIDNQVYEERVTEYTGLLSGTLVYSSNGNPLTGNVTLHRGQETVQTSVLDINGEFTFNNVPAKNNYKIKYDTTTIRGGIIVLPESNSSLELELEV